MRVAIVGMGAWSSAGRGVDPLFRRVLQGQHAFTDRPPYPAEGLRQPRCAVIPDLPRDRPAEHLLLAAAREALSQARLGSGDLPAGCGVAIGTASGNVCGPWERWHRAVLAGQPADERGCGRHDPALHLADALGVDGPCVTISIACASGTAALHLAMGWLRSGRCEVALAGGVDALSLYVHAGFAGLGALASELPRPFHPGRDGLLLGEGAAVLLLVSEAFLARRGMRPLAWLAGSGLAADAFHITAPQREGRGSAAAMHRALADAGIAPDAVDLVSVHGTGTRFNDAMEARALRTVFGDRPLAIHGIKQVIGHTLGAAGALEAVVLVEALRRGRVPPPPGPTDPADPLPPPPAPPPEPRLGLSVSSAFGGANAALLVARDAPPHGPARGSCRVRTVEEVLVEIPPGPVAWRKLWPAAPDRLGRLDRYARVGLLALARVVERVAPLPPDTGLVLHTRHGCRWTDLVYHRRLVEEGPARVSRAAFVYTIPSAPVAEAGIHWNLQGPVLALYGGAEEADAAARDLVVRGATRQVLRLDCDAPDPDRTAHARARLIVEADVRSAVRPRR